MAEKDLKVQSVLLSLLGFVALWAIVTDAWGYSSHLALNSGDYLYAYLSRLIWVSPALWLILRHRSSLCFRKGGLGSCPVWNRSLAIVMAVSLLYSFAGMLAAHGGFWLNPDICLPLEILKIILVSFVEEMVFRGWGYNTLLKKVPDRKAAAYSTGFFVLLHWPAYLIRLSRFGTMDFSAWLVQSLTAAVWGILCCWLMKKGKTLWNPIIAHAFYDLLCVLFVG